MGQEINFTERHEINQKKSEAEINKRKVSLAPADQQPQSKRRRKINEDQVEVKNSR